MDRCVVYDYFPQKTLPLIAMQSFHVAALLSLGLSFGSRFTAIHKGIRSSTAEGSPHNVAQRHWDEIGRQKMHEAELRTTSDAKGDQEHVCNCKHSSDYIPNDARLTELSRAQQSQARC